LLISAVDRGPSIAVPALCLASAALFRPAIIDHLADLVASGPPSAIEIVSLTRTGEVARLRAEHPGLGWPALHATSTASVARIPLVTTDPGRYANTVVETLHL